MHGHNHHHQQRRAAGAPTLCRILIHLLLASAAAGRVVVPSFSSSSSMAGFLRPPPLTNSCARTVTRSGSGSSSSSSSSSIVMSASSGNKNDKNKKVNNNKTNGRSNQLPTFKSSVTNQVEAPSTTATTTNITPPHSNIGGSSDRSSNNMIKSIPIPSPSSKRTAASSYVSGGKVPGYVADANKAIVDSIKGALFALYGERHYARFHALETIARVPYFAYTSVLHLYETLGWRRRSDLMKVHFAESWNELHHLLIMEELGGNKEWGDRVVAVHLAFFYYWVAIALYMASPETAYNLNEQVERHAFDTYDKFLETHEEELKSLPPPKVAKEYYQTGDLYMFDEFHTTTPAERRRPKIDTLYDVFVNIRNDEREHFMTMAEMQKIGGDLGIISPNTLNPLNNPKRGM